MTINSGGSPSLPVLIRNRQPNADAAAAIYPQSPPDLPIPPDAFIRPASTRVWGTAKIWVRFRAKTWPTPRRDRKSQRVIQ
jgi:hypothetical protein